MVPGPGPILATPRPPVGGWPQRSGSRGKPRAVRARRRASNSSG
jgi:hypothetical protein